MKLQETLQQRYNELSRKLAEVNEEIHTKRTVGQERVLKQHQAVTEGRQNEVVIIAKELGLAIEPYTPPKQED